MRTCTWLVVLLAGGALAVGACSTKTSDDDETGDGGSGAQATTTTTFTSTTTTPSTSTSSTTTTTTTGMQDICGSGIGTESEALNECVTEFCCDSFNPCAADATCEECLLSAGEGCESNSLYNAYLTCEESNCPLGVCDSGLTFTDSETMEPAFECIACASSSCCDEATACTGDGSDAAVQACIDCSNGEATCTDTTIQAAADALYTCLSDSCAAECGA